MTAEDWQLVWFTAWVSALSTILILPFGVATAWLLARRDWPGKSLVETIVSLPLVMPPVATGLILLKLLGGMEQWEIFSTHASVSTSHLAGAAS